MRIIILIGFIVLLTACQSVQDNMSEQQLAAMDNVQLGLAYLQQQDPPRAKEKLLLALQEDPHSSVVQDAMAYYLEVTGNERDAQQYYQRAIELAPNKGEALNNYGTFLCRHGQAEQAIKLFLQAVNDPNYINSAAAYENAGLCALTISNQAQARTFFIKALQQDPNRTTSKIELDKLNAGN